MEDKNSVLQRNREHQREEAHRKAVEAIRILEASGKVINFCSVGKQSGVFRSFLYHDMVICQTIDEHRARCVQNDINRRAKYDKTSGSKDVILKAKKTYS